MNTISYIKICIKIVFCSNYAKIRLFNSTLNTPNQNTSYLKIRICITKICLAKSKIRSYLPDGGERRQAGPGCVGCVTALPCKNVQKFAPTVFKSYTC